MKISTNGKRNITLDFNAPKNFRIVQNGVEIPYLRTGKNSFRLSKKVDGDIEMEEVKEKAKRIKPFSLQSPQMTFISSDDVDKLNSAIEQISLVNPQDVAAINNAAEKIDSSQMYIAEKQQQLEATQTYIDQQQQRLNETALGIQALETDNSQRLNGAENAILNLAGEISNAQNMAVEGMNTALNKIEEQGILLQAEIDTKADKDELESLKKDFEEKSDRISSAMANYSGGTAYDTLPQGGEAGQILAKRTDRQGDYIWIDQTPVIVKSETIPTASEKYKGEVYQYVGETGDYTHGYIYECQQNGTSYEWVRIDVQPNTAVWGQITGTLSDQTDLQNALDNKQDKLSQMQMDAVNSGANQSNIAQITTNQSNINTINSKIPAQASSSNQLADKDWVENKGYITGINSGDVTTALGYTPYNSSNPDGFISGITSSDVTTALGYTPYNSSNPNGYTTNVGTVTSVNSVSPVNGNVTISIPTVDQTYSASSTNAQSGTAVASAISGKANSATTLAGYGITNAYTKTEIDGMVSSAMHFKGTVASSSNLPSSGQQVGDMYNVLDTGSNYAWDGTQWDKLSENIDLSGLQPNLTSANAGTGISITNSGSSVVISNTQISAEWGAITGTLSNQTDLNNALNLKQDEETAVNYDNISNCITEIPQDIKLELNNGTLTLKAGSKVYVPNGTGVFDAVTVSNDISIPAVANRKTMIFYKNGSFQRMDVDYCYSGTSAPTLSQTTLAVWYDTTNNIIKYTDNGGSTWNANNISLPVCIAAETTTAFSSIDQVFNGFGYIGSTVFALPGVKGLIPNGRNADGTLKNIEFINSRVDINEITGTRDNYVIRVASNYIRWGIMNYDEEKNLNIFYDNTIKQEVIAGTFSSNNGVITSFKPKTAFHAVDYNDFSDLKDTVDNTVKLTGNQTITGTKAFTSAPYVVSSSDTRYMCKNSDIQQGTAPSSTKFGGFRFLDKNGVELGTTYSSYRTDGSTRTALWVRSPVSGGTSASEISIACDSSGTFYTAAPTPATSDNSTKIATTAYVNNKFQVVSALPDNPDADTFYYITE